MMWKVCKTFSLLCFLEDLTHRIGFLGMGHSGLGSTSRDLGAQKGDDPSTSLCELEHWSVESDRSVWCCVAVTQNELA